MSKLTGLSTQELLHIKLNYSIQIHRIAKNQAKRELKLHAFYVNLMAEYTSALMLADD
jgi:lipopolysaccharide biosynthesis protein